jgi:hypothetical protein
MRSPRGKVEKRKLSPEPQEALIHNGPVEEEAPVNTVKKQNSEG